MTLILHYAPGTIAAASLAALSEAGANYRVQRVDFGAGGQRSAGYLALNPKGRVPVLETPHGVLTETIAILEWIAAHYPEAGLMPRDPWQAARAREVMAYLASTMHVNHAHKMRGHRWADDPAAHAAMTAKVPETMADSAAYLEDRAQEAGQWVVDTFSVADLYLWAVTSWLDGDGVPLAGYPWLAAHHAAIAARPAVVRALDD